MFSYIYQNSKIIKLRERFCFQFDETNSQGCQSMCEPSNFSHHSTNYRVVVQYINRSGPKQGTLAKSFPGRVVLISLADKNKRHGYKSAKLDIILSSVWIHLSVLTDVRQMLHVSENQQMLCLNRPSIVLCHKSSHSPAVGRRLTAALKQTDFVKAAMSHRDNWASYWKFIKPVSGWGEVWVCTLKIPLDLFMQAPITQPMEFNWTQEIYRGYIHTISVEAISKGDWCDNEHKAIL